MSDINYGSNEADYNDALARWRGEKGQIQDREKAQRKLRDAEAESARAGEENLGTRKGVTEVISEQATAIEASVNALRQETDLLRANTLAWREAGGARAAALGAVDTTALAAAPGAAASRYGATTVGYSGGALEQFEQQRVKAEAGQAAARVAAADAAQAAAIRAAAPAREAESGLFGPLLERQRARQAFTERELERLSTEPLLARQERTGGTSFAGGKRPPEYATELERRQALGLPAAGQTTPGGTTLIGGPRGPAQSVFERGTPPPRWRGEDAGLGEFGPAAATKDEQVLVRAQTAARASLAGVGQELAVVNQQWRISAAETAAASQALTRHGALSSEFVQSLARGEVTLQEFGGALTTTIGKFAGWAVAGGLVYGAFEALKHVVKGGEETATKAAQLERVGLPDFNRGQAEAGFRDVGRRLNVPISEVGDAQFYAARSGFNRSQRESLEAAETSILAEKLDLVPIQEATRGLGAVRVAFNLNASDIRKVFNELDVGQLKFNARLQQTLPYLGRAAGAFAVSGSTVQQLTRQIVNLTGLIPGGGGGGGSGSAATFFTREPGNLRKPSSEDTLRLYGFDPRTPVATLNEQIQQAVRSRRTPAGQAIAPIPPGQTTPLSNAQTVLYKLAESISGGPALAGRYGVPFLANAQRQVQINKELSHAEGAAGEDLKAKLGQFDEQLKAVGYAFERVGSEIGQSGVVAVGEDFISIMRRIGEATGFVLGPLGQIGDVFSSLPAALQDIVVAGGILAGVSRAGGFGLLQSPGDKEYVKAAQRTTSEGLSRQKDIAERQTRELESGVAAHEDILARKARFAQGEGAPIFSGALAYDDPERNRLQKKVGEFDDEASRQEDRNRRKREQVVQTRRRISQLEGDQAIIDDRNLGSTQTAARLRERGVYVAPRGIATNEPLLSPEYKPSGTAYEARQTVPFAGERAVVLDTAGQRVAKSLDNSAAEIGTAGAATAAAMVETEVVTTTSAARLRLAWNLAYEQVVQGGAKIGEAATFTAAEIRGGGVLGAPGALREGAGLGRQGLRDITGGGATLFGAAGQEIGANALKGLMYAFIGSAVSEIAGQATGAVFGKKAGSVVSGIGSDVALGAGVGALVGAPEIGAAVGLGAGILDQAGVFGGGSREGKVKGERLKYENQRLEEGAKANVASIEGQSLEFAKELEASVKDESEGAQKAKEKVNKIIKNLGATVTVFGLSSPQGLEAQEKLYSTVATSYLRQFRVAPGGAHQAEAAAAFQEATQAASKAAQENLNAELPFASTPQAISGVEQRNLHGFDVTRKKIADEETQLVTEQRTAKQQLARDEGAAKREVAQLASEGVQNPQVSPSLGDKLEKDRAAIASFARVLKNVQSNKQRIEQQLQLLELEKVTLPAVQKQEELVKQTFGREGALAGAEPSAKRKAAEHELSEQGRSELPLLHKGAAGKKLYNEKQAEREGKFQQFQEEGAKEKLELRERQGAREAAQLPVGASPADQAAVKLRTAQGVLAIIKRNEHKAFTQAQLEGAQLQVEEAQKSQAEAISNTAKELISLNARIRQARDAGNALAQAGDAAQEASELAAVAKTPKEKAEATLAGINAANQGQQAAEQHIAALGALAESTDYGTIAKLKDKLHTLQQQIGSAKPDEALQLRAEYNNTLQQLAQAKQQEIEELGQLAESKELNPLERDKTHLKNLRKLQANAKTPEERRKYQTEINTTNIKVAEDTSSEVEGQTDAELHMHKISTETALKRLRGLLTLKNLSKAAKLQIESRIYDLENEGGAESFAVGRIAHFPTYYQAATATPGNRLHERIAAGHSGPGVDVIGQHAQPITAAHRGEEQKGRGPTAHIAIDSIHHPPQLHQTNHITVVVEGGNPRKVVNELERVFRVQTRSQLRSARLVS